MAVTIEEHYGCRWTWNGPRTARPASSTSCRPGPRRCSRACQEGAIKSYTVDAWRDAAEGLSVGRSRWPRAGLPDREALDIDKFVDGSILVTSITDPDWVPIMKRAAAIVTDHGGRTSHAAIVSRELGLPAIVGTGNATHVLHDEQEVTCPAPRATKGFVYAGHRRDRRSRSSISTMPETKTKHHAEPRQPGRRRALVAAAGDGVGLARMEFVVNERDQGAPDGAAAARQVKTRTKAEIEALTKGYETRPTISSTRWRAGSAGSRRSPIPTR
jgi:pyruvate,water dikinase